MKFPRSAGILLHPTSLPGPYGIGTMGAEARAFVDFLAEAGIGLWQTLPLGPTGYGDSPYQSLSAFAGNPYLIDPGVLRDQGLLGDAECRDAMWPNAGKVDFGRLFIERNRLLDAAWEKFSRDPPAGMREDLEAFIRRNSSWLEDYALFSAIKERCAHVRWDAWPAGLRMREKKALADFSGRYGHRTGRHRFVQYLFFRQWESLHKYANGNGVRIIGDIPIFMAYDSSDVWARSDLFQLDGNRNPVKVSGVPPDYFTSTGQLWGNPLYDWKACRAESYSWWIQRIKASLSMADILRIDHFRGFESNWAVPASHPTAEKGAWEPGPGKAFFKAVEAELGELPVIAEDLGFITPEVERLREDLGFPGMKILQFAFEPSTDNADYPHNYMRDSVVYTGTHDNDTCAGWLGEASVEARSRALAYVGGNRKSFARNMIRTAWASPACMAIAPAQDILGLGQEARMNFPGRPGGYWTWRMADGAFSPLIAKKLRRLGRIYFRLG